MKVSLPFSPRARQYGYIYWTRADDARMAAFFGDAKSVAVVFNGRPLGEKRIDWQYRRISLGYRQTRNAAADATLFHLSSRTTGALEVKCR